MSTICRHYQVSHLGCTDLFTPVTDDCMVQWVERRQLANFPCPMLDLQLTGNHLCG